MSKRRPWFRCFPAQYLDGLRGLGDELGLAYTRIFIKMYADNGPIANDEQLLKHLLEKRPQDVRRIIGRLVDLGKLTIADGLIRNARVDAELSWTREKWDEIGSIKSPPFPGSSSGHSGGDSDEKPNESYARAHDRTRPRQTKTNIKGSTLPTAERAAVPSKVGSSRSEPPEERASVARDLGITPPARSQAPSLSQPLHPPKMPTRMANDWDLPQPKPIGETEFLKAYREANGDFSKLPEKHSAPHQPLRPADDEALMDRTNKRLGPSKPPPGTTKPELEKRQEDYRNMPKPNTEDGT